MKQKRIKMHGIVRFLSLSIGVTASQLALILIGMSDSIMMGRQSSGGLAAGTWVTSIYNLGLLFCMGMIIPIGIQLGRLKSENDGREKNEIISGYFRIVIMLSAAVILILLLAVKLGSYVGKDPVMLKIAWEYALGIVPGILPWVIFYLIRNILLCYQKVKLTTLLSVLAVFLNIGLNYLFIYGAGPFRGFGTFGCAVATSCTNWIIFLAAYGILKKDRTILPALRNIIKRHKGQEKESWRLGFPTGIMFFSESLIFAVGNILLSGISTEAVVAFGIAVSWLNLSYMFPVALSLVLTEPLSEYFAVGKKKEFGLLSHASLWTILIYNAVWIILIFVFKKTLIYTIVGSNCTKQIYILAEKFLYLTAAIMFVYNYIVVFSGILRGLADVKTPLFMMFIMYWGIGVGGTMVLTFFVGEFGVLLGMLLGFSLTLIGVWQTYQKKTGGKFNHAR